MAKNRVVCVLSYEVDDEVAPAYYAIDAARKMHRNAELPDGVVYAAGWVTVGPIAEQVLAAVDG